jgi:hypothetical protein
LSDGFEDALSANLNGVLDALRIAAEDLTGADGHALKVYFRFLFAINLALSFGL